MNSLAFFILSIENEHILLASRSQINNSASTLLTLESKESWTRSDKINIYGLIEFFTLFQLKEPHLPFWRRRVPVFLCSYAVMLFLVSLALGLSIFVLAKLWLEENVLLCIVDCLFCCSCWTAKIFKIRQGKIKNLRQPKNCNIK